jgi:cyclopropane fatty-acyl-phospholipid synthase-like methyltransferase
MDQHGTPAGLGDPNRAAWNRIFAAVPEEWYTAPPSRAMLECTDFLKSGGARSVLDLGCGMGRWSVHFARAGMDVSGIDYASNAVELARRWADAEGLGIRFACRAVTEEAFPGETFDAAVAALVLDNIAREEMREAIGRMHAALRPGGLAFCLFNPIAVCADDDADNPTTGLTRVVYRDAELVEAFSGFEVLDRRMYEAGTRGIYLRAGVGPTAGAVPR